MCRLTEAIDSVGVAADRLTQVCIRHSSAVDAAIIESPTVVAFRRKYRPNFLTPTDMLDLVEKIK